MAVQRPFTALIGVVLVAQAPGIVFAQVHTIKPAKNLITGVVDGEDVEELSPPNGFITSKDDFDNLWRGWLLEEKVPDVDFKKNLVVVATSRDGPIEEAVLVDENKTGDMKIRVKLERKTGGKALHVWIAVFARDGIKTIEGRVVTER